MFVLDVDTVTLDESLLEDEPGCEFRHRQLACSQEVTHIITGCLGPALVCTNAAEYKQQGIDGGNTICKCGRFAQDCWKIRPA